MSSWNPEHIFLGVIIQRIYCLKIIVIKGNCRKIPCTKYKKTVIIGVLMLTILYIQRSLR